MDRQKLIRRLLSLRNWEAFNILFLPACLWFMLVKLEVHNWQPYAAGMFIICVILAQGVLYWQLKLQAIQHGKTLPAYFNRLYSVFKWVDVGLLVLCPLLALPGWLTPAMNFQISFGSTLVYLFAILEYVNYYYYQLSHDNWNDIQYLLKHRRLRRSHLYMDMHREGTTI
jgi:hypothetical protein